MDHSLTEDEINTIVSSLRRGIPIREAERKEFARKTRFFLKDAQSYRQTCEFLAQKCLDEMAKVNWETDDTWKSGVVEEIQWWWTWINRLRE